MKSDPLSIDGRLGGGDRQTGVWAIWLDGGGDRDNREGGEIKHKHKTQD